MPTDRKYPLKLLSRREFKGVFNIFFNAQFVDSQKPLVAAAVVKAKRTGMENERETEYFIHLAGARRRRCCRHSEKSINDNIYIYI